MLDYYSVYSIPTAESDEPFVRCLRHAYSFHWLSHSCSYDTHEPEELQTFVLQQLRGVLTSDRCEVCVDYDASAS